MTTIPTSPKSRSLTLDEQWDIILRKREENNRLFIGWAKASHNCPNCRDAAAKAFHTRIFWNDLDINTATKKVLGK